MKNLPSDAAVLCDTQTLTEVRKETHDQPDRTTLLETMTKTAVRPETHDSDPGGMEVSSDAWEAGLRTHVLFESARTALREIAKPNYDSSAQVSVDEQGTPLALVGSSLSETMTHTAVRAETDDADR